MFLKVGNILNFIYDKITAIILIIVLLISAYFVYDMFYIRFISSGNDWLAYKPDNNNLGKYKDLSDECIGWITIDNTTIDYPIMQASDNSKYLNTNPYGEYSLSGSIFLDYKNKKDFSDPFSLIYGHHMSNYQMFGALDRFENRNYFDSHITGTLIADEKKMPIEVFAFSQIDANVKMIFDPTNNSGQFEWVKSHNKYFREPKSNERIIALSTCKDPGTTERTVLFVSIKK